MVGQTFTLDCRTRYGFTLVELLVSLAVISIIAGFTAVSFREYAKAQQLGAEVNAVARGIEDQRAKTLASLNNSVYGVAIASTSIIYFTGTTYVPGASTNTVYPLTATRAIASLSNGQSSFVFSKITGVTSATGTIQLVSDLLSSTTTLTIYGSGLIE